MKRSGAFAIVAGLPVLIGSMGAVPVARAGGLHRLQQHGSASPLRPDLPPEGVSAAEWPQVLARFGETRYDARPAPDSGAGEHWLVTNPALGIEAQFSANGLRVGPRGRGAGAAWSWGAKLTGFGPIGAVRPVAAPELVAQRNRVEYRRSGLTEWYVNDRRGLEQGFTIDRAPTGGAVRLEIVMALSGSLLPSVDSDADALVLRDAAGGTVLRYGGLCAYDTEGRPLAARIGIEKAPDRLARLHIEVDVVGATFPIVIDPLITTQIAKLTASDAATNDQFGRSLASSGDTVVVGAAFDDDAGSSSGSAYVFTRNQGGADSWDEVAKLTASDAFAEDQFGFKVAISGDTVVVGAPGNDGAALNTGAAYVFERNAGGADGWDQIARLTASDAAAVDNFGWSVSISGDTVVVGAFQNDDAGLSSGSAYVFQRNAGGADAWGEVAKLTASDAAANDQFGYSVSISGDALTVGAPLNGDAGPHSGSAYVFERNQGGADEWGEVAKLTASDAAAEDQFGYSASISGDRVAIGAFLNPFTTLGSVYVFERNRGGADSWDEMAKLTASDAAAGDRFGISVSMSGDAVVVGALLNDDAGSNSGSAYVFERNAGGADHWDEVAKLTASDAAEGDQFGVAASISGNTIVVGAYGDDDAGSASGSAYTFMNLGCEWAQVIKSAALDAAAGDEFGYSVSVSEDRVAVGAAQHDHAGMASGSAYVFERNQGGADHWAEVAELIASDAAAGDNFGFSVSNSVDTVVVGAALNDDAGASSGSAYVFERNQGGADRWDEVAKLTASDAAAGDQFGTSVSIGIDTVVVGAPYNDDAGSNSGSAYIFVRNQGGITDSWDEAAKLIASDAAADDQFGYSVSISGDTVVVGAEQNDGAGGNSGSAYVFQRNHGGMADSWGQVAKLTASDAALADLFGHSVSIAGDTLAVGAWGNDDAGGNSGSAYVFERNAGGADSWGEVAKLAASDAAAADRFGYAVSISADTVVVGASQSDAVGSAPGSVYAFERNQGGADSWDQVAKLSADDAAAGDGFGRSVSVNQDAIVVGAYTNDDAGSGSAYVFNCLDPTGDPDLDGRANAVDCAPFNNGIWSVPGEARDLQLAHDSASGVTLLSWVPPDEPGAWTSVRHDAMRTATASDFTTAWFCVYSDGLGTATADPDPDPMLPRAVYFYLVRTENDCGPGSAGASSAGALRPIGDCP